MLSVVIPTYNEEVLLPRLLASLKCQTYRGLEIIVADAQSTDRTRALAAAAGCRVVDGGLPARGRNLGAKVAQGDLLLFLDADVVLPDARFVERVIAAMDERRIDVATCLIEPLSERIIDRVSHRLYNNYITAMEHVFPHAHGPCMVVRRSTHEAISGFDEAVTLAEDHDYAQRARRAGFRCRVIRNPRILLSVRRFARDGYLSTAAKYALCEMHMLAIGPVKTDLFRYRFGYSKDAVSSKDL